MRKNEPSRAHAARLRLLVAQGGAHAERLDAQLASGGPPLLAVVGEACDEGHEAGGALGAGHREGARRLVAAANQAE
ncbi:MAG: hypothetical protein IPQ09_23060 [Myxococcales bacterium]|nr:hypothetical protein [Myxococcales bacterium]